MVKNGLKQKSDFLLKPFGGRNTLDTHCTFRIDIGISCFDLFLIPTPCFSSHPIVTAGVLCGNQSGWTPRDFRVIWQDPSNVGHCNGQLHPSDGGTHWFGEIGCMYLWMVDVILWIGLDGVHSTVCFVQIFVSWVICIWYICWMEKTSSDVGSVQGTTNLRKWYWQYVANMHIK